ncbi:para-nitrobenzyl esterase [Microbacterium sp. AG1240]|uniref:carboxylesterase/lipase family protein n=1 Tax=Microbacterium sp. AG1240 TaxID=2183992 RepID=UPI000EB499C8|nr:carboxylesterase family protein [Microbacterium sp. AG1240]RKT37069.1 para-nitrobenzyl esterase [Microbacterium sp. AG1240]
MTDQRRRGWLWAPLAAVGVIGAVLAWLNGAHWWGWALVGGAVVLAGFAARLWRRRRWFIQGAAWIASAAVIGGTALVAGPPPASRTLEGPHTDPVATAQGDVIGVRDDASGVDAFAGIPYAAPPVGPLRWEAPAPALLRQSPLIADDFGPSAIQPEPTFLTRAATRVLDLPLEDTLLGGYETDEDSLRLNIWKPSGAADTPRAVLVYLHGGGFVAGSGALPAYDGAALASRGDIVVVTINYRLGVFGFLAGDALGGTTTGNQGLLDQIAALRWIQDNIAAFDGDPDRVTVAGESAGSGSACILGASPLAAGLLHGIIGESGGCLGTAGNREEGDLYDEPSEARDAARELSAALDGASLEEMRAMPASRIASAAKTLSAHWWPSIDGDVLPDTPSSIYAAGRQNDVPLLLGSNSDETSFDLVSGLDSDPDTYAREAHEQYGDDADLFLELYPGDDAQQVVASRISATTDRSMTAPMREWALAAAESGQSAVYSYYFSRTPPDPKLERFGAYHGAEVMYAYGNLGADGDADYTDVDVELEREMSERWIAFTTQHHPNTPHRAGWPTLQEAPGLVLEFGDATSVAPRPSAAAVDFWLGRGEKP